MSEKTLPITYSFGVVAGLGALLFIFAVSVRRFHDLDKSGWWAALTLVPVVGWLVIIVWCGFVRGVVGRNSFGPDPFDQVLPKRPIIKNRLSIALCGAVALLAIGSVAILLFGFEETGARLDRLSSLSIETTKRVENSGIDWRELARKSEAVTGDAEAYCSRTIIRDYMLEEPKPADDIISQWRTDFVRPDRWHVTQQMWDPELGDLWDEWVSIGGENYQNAGLWTLTEPGQNDLLNQSLSIGSMIEFLNLVPDALGVYSQEGTQYLLLEYSISDFRNNPLFAVCEDVGCQVQVWIQTASGFVVKGSLQSNDSSVHIDQMYTCFNEPVEVVPPPWLNATLDSVGTLRITNTKIPVVPHYP